MPDGRYLAPQPAYTLMRIGPSGLYYIGAGHGGDDFTTELGHVFEHYVGMQLALLPDKELHGEIEYDRDGNKKTVDWIVEFDDLLVLVEAKATPMTAAARVGLDRLAADVRRTIHRGIDQINTTVRLIEARHPALAHLPADREMIDLVVTLEPYFMANSGFADRAEAAIPTLSCAARNLEQLVTAGLDESASRLLREIVVDPDRRTWDIGTALGDRGTVTKNPVLDDAWQAFAFRDV